MSTQPLPITASAATEPISLAREVFQRLDRDGNGSISRKELKLAIKEAGLPPKTASQLFKITDSDKDQKISLDEFENYVMMQYSTLRAVFNSMDENGNGYIDFEEIAATLDELDMVGDDDTVHRLIAYVTRDPTATQVSFTQWCQLLLLLPKATLEDALTFWEDVALVNDEDDIYVPKKAGETTVASIVRNFLSGGLASILAKTGTAPLERLKLIYQVTHNRPPSMWHGLVAMYNSGGLLSLFRGNLVNILKSSPKSAVQLSSFERIRDLFKPATVVPEPVRLFAAGALAGVLAHCTVYPLDVVKIRLAAAPEGTYAGATDVIRKTIQSEGFPKPFYRGLSTVVYSTVPHSGTTLMVYDMGKRMILSRIDPDDNGGHGLASAAALMGVASVSSLVGEGIAYPMHVVKARLVMQNVVPSEQARYTGVFDVLKQTAQKEGFTGLYRGFLPSILKGVPAHCITFGVYEFLKQFGIEKKKKKKHHKKE